MKVYHNIDEFEGCGNAVVTTGTFDGVHIGHQKIIHRLREIAESCSGETVILTFDPHPRQVLKPNEPLKLINSLNERIRLLEKMNINHLIVHPFSKRFAETTSLDFIREILVKKIGTKKLVIGYDHHFGKNREGSFDSLKESAPEYGFDLEEISAHDIDDVSVSSTKIRNALMDGNISIANTFLGSPFVITGSVIPGQKKGRSIGFPTANIKIDSHKILPKDGVYAVRVLLGKKEHMGMLNIGVRPTVSNNLKQSVEVNIFDFDGEIYGNELELQLLQRIRDEQKFETLELLKTQLKKDKLTVLNTQY